jgi:acyl-CoA synthetase (AMP-forming)/AMP-acid ligase II
VDTGVLLRGATRALADTLPDRVAISLEDEASWTYRELEEYANRAANALSGLGVCRGDRVGLFLYNSLEYVGLYFAITRLGAIAVRLNWRLASEELEYAIEDSGCSVVCVHDALLPEIEPIRDRLDVRTFLGFSYDGADFPAWITDSRCVDESPSTAPSAPTPGGEERAMIMYTSGTTGRPKGAVWTHAATVSFAAMQQLAWDYGPETVTMTTGPLFHVGSFEDLVLPTLLARGRAIVTRSRGFTIERVLELWEKLAVTDGALQPTMIYDMLRSPALSPARLRLQRLYTGGTNVEQWALDRLGSELGDLEIVALYGLTEGGAISTWGKLGPEDFVGNVVGVPLPLSELRLARDDGTEVAGGEEGEVWVRSASSSREYWNKPQASAETFVDGWCRTGDLGRMVEGRLHITGRSKDMIKSGGENVYPVEVENVLLEHPAVAEVAVIGVPDTTYHEAVCAVVVPSRLGEVDAGELVAYCRDRLAGYKKPRYVVAVEDLPRTVTGKVRKQELRERFEYIEKERGDDD